MVWSIDQASLAYDNETGILIPGLFLCEKEYPPR
jgi:hypothetical protein